MEACEDRLVPATFLVTTTDDAGLGSLRQAILDANAEAGPDVIAFQIGDGGVQTIRPVKALPHVTDAVWIDGTTQPGYQGTPLIEVDGSKAAGANGLTLAANDSTVHGLALHRFTWALVITGNNNLVQSTYFGTDASGTRAQGGGGITVLGNDNWIGSPGAGNLISGTSLDQPALRITGRGTRVQGNFVGTNAVGDAVLPNQRGGIDVHAPAADTLIGGVEPGAGNLISGNHWTTVYCTVATVFQGNFVNSDVTGTRELWINSGVSFSAGMVGGTKPGAGNLILGGLGVGNGSVVQGNLLGTDVTGTRQISFGILGASDNNLIGGTEPGAGNLFGRISISGSNNRVQGNLIGTDVTGTRAWGGQVSIYRGRNNLIGGTEPGAGNLISGNRADGVGRGIEIRSTETQENIVQGNRIGTDVTGTVALPNMYGVVIQDSPNNLIGGTEPGARNLISGNIYDGVRITGAAATGNRVQGNWIGIDDSGAHRLGNGWSGVATFEAYGNLIGGFEPGAANWIAYNGRAGVTAGGSSNGIRRNVIAGHAPSFGISPGANGNQSAPWIDWAVAGAEEMTIGITLISQPNTLYTIEFFANLACSGTGFGEGEEYVGSYEVLTGPDGYGNQVGALPVAVPPGRFLSATATDPNNSTSAFALCHQVASGGAPSPHQPPDNFWLGLGARSLESASEVTRLVDLLFVTDGQGDHERPLRPAPFFEDSVAVPREVNHPADTAADALAAMLNLLTGW